MTKLRVHKLKNKNKTKVTKKNLTINKTCVCDPHCLYIFFNLVHWEEGKKRKKGDYKIWTQSRQLTVYKLSVNIYETTFHPAFLKYTSPFTRPHAFS